MKSIVVYGTRFGNTKKVAEALVAGLSEAGVDATSANVEGLASGTLDRYDLICLGAPTEAFSAYKPMKAFLATLKDEHLSGKSGFAFDTKIESRLSGSAAKYIEHCFGDLGIRIVASRESAIVSTKSGMGGISGAALKAGEEERFKEVGRRIGVDLVPKRAELAPRL